ncbi:TRAPP III-specific subunit 85 family protein [Aspergillus mulundensis]|uniref:PutativeTRAPP (Transport protein particle) complex protein TRS85 n=1 Tax=Aspergillus mulundensis TaxID=1810919 RepID=A0A3D8RZC2_9EURO|nr:putativeTRAPP (Transport protein particle) complex protein TRS85 [Aspergillus mulundensis]RDW79194.1 putativeTRAPP (Transport protein particle) complex protein TRS85 [Aspergillus mulundensis]
MTSPGDAAPVKPPPSFSPGVPRVSSKTRYPERRDSSASLDPERVEPRIASPPTIPLSNTTDLPIRSGSPSARSVRSTTPQIGRTSLGSPLDGRADSALDTRSLIIRSFSPVVGVYSSPDTDELVRQKGFKGGFWELIRPFGENVPGKLVIRDSIGSSRGWEDYGVRFVDLGEICRAPNDPNQGRSSPLAQVEAVLAKQLDSTDGPPSGAIHPQDLVGLSSTSPLYKLYLRQLLSIASVSPHETFRHPVASVIAISSRNSAPLESLRQLYADTNNGQRKVPEWIHPEYLRYYVLVHDEDRDDITASTKLYDQMKRHFGLHCHLLRLRSNQCVVTDDDSVQVPECEWLSPSERLSERPEPLVDLDSDGLLYLFDSDVMAIKGFVRELIAQSVVPFMENRVAVWNDQVASRRRGISGRFMSMSRKWAGFGSSSRSSSGSGGASGNYNVSQGYYHYDHSEAILRKMADYAFMLRDWKLAASTYELLRSDYANDKAWKYHAGAYEMCAVSTLLNPLGAGSKIKVEAIDQMFDTACYSYLTRCSDAPTTLRCLTLAVELLRSRGGSAAESAAKWAMRAMDLGLVESVGQGLLSERISSCYASRPPPNGVRFGGRRRKAGMWSLFAADMWLRLGKPALASACLEEAERLYADVLGSDGVFPMPEMQTFVDNLRLSVKVGYLEARGLDIKEETGSTDPLDDEETSEKLDRRMNRRSLIGNLNPLDTATLAQLQTTRDGDSVPSDDFERA